MRYGTYGYGLDNWIGFYQVMTLCIPRAMMTTKTNSKYAHWSMKTTFAIFILMRINCMCFMGLGYLIFILHACVQVSSLLEHYIYMRPKEGPREEGISLMRGENTYKQGRKGCKILYLSFFVLRPYMLFMDVPMLQHLRTHYQNFFSFQRGPLGLPKFSLPQGTQLSYCV